MCLHVMKKLALSKVYYFAVGCYILPILFFGVFLFDQFFIHKTDMLFWIIFLLSLIPCGLLGFVLFLAGFIKALKQSYWLNKLIGGIGTLLGIGIIGGGLLGLLLIYVVIGA